ncbi:unnamed protein product [Zymoseptoria tritici ST99CH_3D1]|nr:unnamed protein product [Zymoseptoria tritici ST99CH_3D1]
MVSNRSLPTDSENTDTTSNPLAALKLDRKAMEEERLARLASRKRERSISPPRSSRKAPKMKETTVELPSGARLNTFSFSGLIEQGQKDRKPDAANKAIASMSSRPANQDVNVVANGQPVGNPNALPAGAIKYPHGVVKKTWAFGHARTGNDIKLEEVLEAQSLKIAVLSAYQWDVEWVMSKLKVPPKGGSTKCVFVMQAKNEEDREQWQREASYMSSFLRLCFPNMKGLINCMHSKLMLLFHPDKLRIAIPTANLLNFDWGETGQMENSVFMVDLPRLADGKISEAGDLPAFGQELIYFLEQQGLDDDVRTGVLKFDFSATKDMAFVHTVGGMHFRDEAERTGLMGLSKAVKQLNLATQDLEIDFAASSIGRLNDNYLRDFHSAAKGINLIAQAAEAKSKAASTFFDRKKASTVAKPDNVREKVRIYFPTASTVRASTAGAAGTLCIARNYFQGSTFPRACFRDYKSTRTGLLSHNKILLARGKRAIADAQAGETEDVAWAYVGSSNMSPSAWGTLPKNRKVNTITCRNWECGVLLPVSRERVLEASMTEENGEGEKQDGQFAADEKAAKKNEQEDGEDSETESEDETPPTDKAKPKAKPVVRSNKRAQQTDGEDSETESEASDSEEPEVPRPVPQSMPKRTGMVDFSVFDGLLSVPFKTPGDRYREGEEPWYFKEQ